MNILETERLVLRHFRADDAPFVLELLNDPSWLRFIGDRGVRTLEDAARYIENGPVAMYRRVGFGLYLVEIKASGEPAGMCGLIKRESLPDVDLGFAFLPEFRAQGLAFESAAAVLDHGRRTHGIARVVAILSPDNDRSTRLLEKLGFRCEGLTRLAADAPELTLYAASP